MFFQMFKRFNKSSRIICLFLQRATNEEKKAAEISGVFGRKPANAYLVTPEKQKPLQFHLIDLYLTLKISDEEVL